MANESSTKRTLLALPLLFLFIIPWLIPEASDALLIPLIYSVVDDGKWTSPRGDILDLTEPRLHIKTLDDLIAPILSVFAPSMSGYDEIGRLQALTFFMDIGPFFVILMLEKMRGRFGGKAVLLYVHFCLCDFWRFLYHEPALTNSKSPFTFALLSQVTGAGKIAGLLFFIDYLWAPLHSFPSNQSMAISKSAAISLPTAMLLVYYPLTLGSYLAPTLSDRAFVNAYWQIFPFLVVMVHSGIGSLIKYSDGTTQSQPQSTGPEPRPITEKSPSTPPDKYKLTGSEKADARPDLPYLTATITFLSALSALSLNYVRFSVPQNSTFLEIFLPISTGDVDRFSFLARRMLQYDQIFWVLAGYYWLFLSTRDIRQRGVSVPWWKVVVGLSLGTATMGSGASFGLAWVLRERALGGCF
ncbi:hypothetical protein BJY04DRAFT_224991 [Aspergillus karnatakaensis]|uniref:uncharacterized protein n=1 Tax=Aspergillus karnatakaensis TaxID=1810916 RepID=UPI003CCCD36F